MSPSLKKDSKMGIKDLVGKKMDKEVPFMGAKVKISKLTVEEVLAIQEMAKSSDNGDDDSLRVLRKVIQSAVEGASELGDDDFRQFPMDELSKLSNEIMKFSGLGQEAGK